MKKSKFLLLGSVASLASIPFVAAKCGETKEEKKNLEGDQKPGESTTNNPRTRYTKTQMKVTNKTQKRYKPVTQISKPAKPDQGKNQ